MDQGRELQHFDWLGHEPAKNSRLVEHVAAAEDDLALSAERLSADGARRHLVVLPRHRLGFYGAGGDGFSEREPRTAGGRGG